MDNKSDILTTEELLDLKKELRSSYLTALTGFLIVMTIIHSLIYIRSDNFEIPKLEIFIIIVTVILTYFLTKYFTRELRSEISDGRKMIVFKKIEDKSEFMDKQDRFSSEFKKYIIFADGQKYVVSEDLYKKAEISDYLAVHMTPLRELTIKTEILKR